MKILTALAIAVVGLLAGTLVGFQLGKKQSPSGDGVESRRDEDPRGSQEPFLDLEVTGDGDESRFAEGASLNESLEGFDEMARRALAFESPRRRAYEIERLFDDLSPEEAPALLEELLQWPNSRERRGMLRPFFVKWGEIEGPTALESAEALMGRDRTDALSAVYAGWAKSDAHAAWDQAKLYLDNSSPYTAYTVRGAMSELAKSDLSLALRELAGTSNDIKVRALTHSLLEGVFESNQAAALATELQLIENDDARKTLTSSLFSRWGEDESEEPMAALARIEDRELAKEAMSGFMMGWMGEDRDGAIRYALDNRDDPLVADSLGTLLGQSVMYGSNGENEQLLADLVEEGVVDSVAKDLVARTSYANSEFALKVVEQVEDADARSQYLQVAMSQYVRNNWDAAIEYYSESIPAAEKAKVLQSISWQLERRPDGATQMASMVADLPDAESRREAVESLLQRTSSPYSQASKEYLESLKAVAAEVDGLSEVAEGLRKKLFGEKE